MLTDPPADLSALLTRLERLHGLPREGRAALAGLPLHEADIAAGDDIVREGGRTGRCAVILEGMACGYRLTGDGRRQILCFHLAGDMPDLQGLHFGTTDAGVAAVSRCRVGFLAHDALRSLCEREPRLASALWRETLLQGAILRAWLLNVGRREAVGRLAHLICETVARHAAAGLTTDRSCDFPLTQSVLADALGLSVVHVNRVIQKLRREGFIAWRGGRLTVTDWEGLQLIADFDPAYLHAHRGPHRPERLP